MPISPSLAQNNAVLLSGLKYINENINNQVNTLRQNKPNTLLVLDVLSFKKTNIPIDKIMKPVNKVEKGKKETGNWIFPLKMY